jgi:hypothetical protein
MANSVLPFKPVLDIIKDRKYNMADVFHEPCMHLNITVIPADFQKLRSDIWTADYLRFLQLVAIATMLVNAPKLQDGG